jgi:hypothetical protein
VKGGRVEIFTKENIAIALGIVGAWPVFKGSASFLTSWNRSRAITSVEKEIAFIRRVKESDRELYVFLFSYVFIITAMISMTIMFDMVSFDEQGRKINMVFRFILGGAAYFFSVYVLGCITRIRNAERTIARLKEKLSKLGKRPQVAQPS